MKTHRFLMVISGYPPWKAAGMERTCQRLSKALVARGHQVTVLTQATATHSGVAMEDGVRVERVLRPLALGPLWGLTYMRQVRAWMKRNRESWDVCVCHKLDLHSFAAVPVARKFGRPCLSALYNAGDFSDFVKLRSYKGGATWLAGALKGDGFLYLSSQSRDELLRNGVPSERVFPFRAPVYLDKFYPLDSSESNDPNLMLFAGRFHPQKNLSLLIEAFDRLAVQRSEVRLKLIGKGPESDRVRKLVEDSPHRDRIDVAEWSDDISGEMRRARAFVLSSDAEGLANVLVEAMASGTPCVCTDVSGSRDALGAGEEPIPGGGGYLNAEAGLIVARRDTTALANAMEKVLADDALRSRLSANGRARAERLFSEDACVELFLQAVDRAMGSEPGR